MAGRKCEGVIHGFGIAGFRILGATSPLVGGELTVVAETSLNTSSLRKQGPIRRGLSFER
jgi:hypothetical protein